MNVSNSTYYASLFQSQVDEFCFQLWGIAGNILAVFGLIANVLSIIVLAHPKIRSSTSYYLITLAVYDNLILIALELFFNLPSLSTRISMMKTFKCYYKRAVPIVYFISLAAQMGSIYTTVAFTVERYIAVCHPFNLSNTCTKSRARKTICLILLFVILYNIPRYFQYDFYETTQPDNTTCIINNSSEFGNHKYFRHVYLVYFQFIFMFLIPFAILLVLNIALLRAVKRSTRNIQHMSSSSSHTNDNNLTVMLISVVLVFLVCQFPSIIDNILLALVQKEILDNSLFYNNFYAVCSFMIEVNSAVNFILYCVFGKKFRTVFILIFGFKTIHNKIQYKSQSNKSTKRVGIRGNEREIETSFV